MIKKSLKFILIIVSLQLSLNSYSQNIKKFELEQCGDSDLFIAKAKKGTGLYNKKKESWAILPSASIFLYQETFDILYQIEDVGGIYAHSINEGTSEFLTFKSADDNCLVFDRNLLGDERYLRFDNMKDFVVRDKYNKGKEIPDSLFFYDNLAIESLDSFNYCSFASGVIIKNGIVINVEKRSNCQSWGAIPSLEYPGEDSVSADGDVVYFEPPEDLDKMGIYSLIKNEWIIAPNEKSIRIWNDFVFVGKDYRKSEGDIEEGEIDVYRMAAEGVLNQIKLGARSISKLPFKEIFPKAESIVVMGEDSTTLKVTEGDTITFFSQKLLHSYKDDVGYSTYRFFGGDVFDVEISAKGEELLRVGSKYTPQYLKLNNEKWQLISENDEGDYESFGMPFSENFEKLVFPEPKNRWEDLHYYLVDDKIYLDSLKDKNSDNWILKEDWPTTSLTQGTMYEIEEGFVMVNETVNKQRWYKDYGENDAAYPEGAKDLKGNPYYFEVGNETSGVYSLKDRRWIIPSNQISVERKGDNFLVYQKENHIYSNSIVGYSLYDAQGKALSEFTGEKEVLFDPEKLKWFIEVSKLDTAFLVSPWNEREAYFTNGPKTGLYDMIVSEVIVEPKVYLKRTPNFSYASNIYIEKEKAYFNILNSKFESELNDGLYYEFGREKGFFTNSQLYFKTDSFEIYIDDYGYNGFNKFDSLPPTKKQFQDLKKIIDGPERYVLDVIDDSLLFVEDYSLDFIDSLKKGRSLSDEDLYKTDEELGVYYVVTNYPGHFRSGIYNFKTNKWLINPQYHWVEIYDDGYLCRKAMILEDELMTSSFLYDFYSANGDEIWVNRSLNQLNDRQKSFVQKQRKITE